MGACDFLVITRDLLKLEEVIGTGTKQQIVSQVVDIPPEKPNAASVVDYTVSFTTSDTSIVPGKVIVNGTINLTVVYEAAVPAQSVHVAHFAIPFTVFVEIPNAQPGQTVSTSVSVEDVEFSVVPPGRQLRVRVVIQLTARVSQTAQLNVITDVAGIAGLVVTKQTIRAQDVLFDGENQFVVRETETIPAEKPPARSIIDSSVTAAVDKTTIVPNKVIVNGTLNTRVIYEALEPTQSVHVVHFAIPFEGFIDVPGVTTAMTVSSDVDVEFASFDVQPPGRNIVARIIIQVMVRVIQTRAVTIVTDVTGGPPELQVTKDLVRIQEVLAENINQSVVREILDIPPEKPPVASVLEHSETVTIDRTIVAPGKVIVEGTIAERIVYEAANETQTVNVAHFAIKFSDFVVLPGAQPGMTVNVTANVEYVAFDVHPPGDPISVQIVLALTAQLVRTRQLQIVTDVFCGPPVGCLITVTADRANVRTGPGLAFDIITTLPKGSQAPFVSISGQWTQIALADRTGWVLSSLIFNPCRPLG